MVVRKSEGADGGPLCTRNFPHSVGAVVTSEGARHSLASM